MRDPILTIEALHVGYNGHTVVSDISLQVQCGEILTLIGPNGAGKSTILKTLTRHLPPISGKVLLNGRDLFHMKEQTIARQVAAVLTGQPKPELMTCYDVIASGRYPYTGRLGILGTNDREKTREAMALVKVNDLADRDFNRISDGQRQRVLLARAICQEPRLLIMDEPTSFLDIKHKLEFLSLLRSLARDRRFAVVLSLHELDLAQRFSDRILCIRDGKPDRLGTPEEIFTEGYIESLYQVEGGSYNPLFGSIEPVPMTGTPRVLVIGGGGSGIPVYRRLQRLSIPFAAGILPENDLDYPVAAALAAQTITVPAFETADEAALERAKTFLEDCETCICTLDHFGPANEMNRRLADLARDMGKLTNNTGLDALTGEQTEKTGASSRPAGNDPEETS